MLTSPGAASQRDARSSRSCEDRSLGFGGVGKACVSVTSLARYSQSKLEDQPPDAIASRRQ
jgi:hypothetical protein